MKSARSTFIAFAALVSALSQATPSLAQQPVKVAAMVIKVEGTAKVEQANAREAIAARARLPVGATLALDADARVLAINLDDGAQVAFAGPGRYRHDGKAWRALAGRSPQTQEVVSGFQALRVEPSRVAQAAVALREGPTDLALETPVRVRTVADRPTFKWNARGDVTRYSFALATESGEAVHVADTKENTLTLPEGIALKRGAVYHWSIEARFINGAQARKFGAFEVASEAQAAAATQLSEKLGKLTGDPAFSKEVLAELRVLPKD